MKSNVLKAIILFLLFSEMTLMAQTPQKMSYQSVVRNAANQLLQNAAVGARISILQGSISGNSVYTETHSLSTNANGLLTLEIGDGNVVSGVFNSINWGNGPYFVKSEIDPAGGVNYTISGTSQLLSVPYAQLAENVVNPKFSTSAFDYSTTFLSRTARNLWQDDPDITLVVPETGKYLLSFYGNASNSNETISGVDPGYDSNCSVRVFNSTTATELTNAVAIEIYFDMYGTPPTLTSVRKFNYLRPSKSVIVNLNIGDILKLQYNQFAIGSPLPTGQWFIGNGGISIMKIGN